MSSLYLITSLVFLALAYFVYRVLIKRDYEKHSGLSPISYILEIIVFAIHANILWFAIPAKWPYFPALPDNPSLVVVSGIVGVIGVIVLLISWFGLGSKTSLGMDKDQLCTSGLYQYSRNPQLVGYGLILISFVILYPSWSSILWIILYVILASFMIISEEEFLERKYKEEYRLYREKVPRILFAKDNHLFGS